MVYQREDIRRASIRVKARAFAAEIKGSHMACKIPNETIDWLDEEEIPYFIACLVSMNLVQRDDWRWEERK